MSDNILVATDFRAQADRAIDRAIKLGEERDWAVTVAHAIKPQFGQRPDMAELERMVRAVLPSAELPISFRFPEGKPHEAIRDLADELLAKLIVIGVARHNSIGDYFLGTAVDYVIRHTDRPVLVVKMRPQNPYRRIIAATDFSDASRFALERAAEMFPEASIDLVHAYRIPFEGWQKAAYVKDHVRESEDAIFKDFLNEVAADVRARVTPRLFYGGPEKAVMDLTRELQCDLVVLGTHGVSGFRQATMGSIALSILETAPVDTLVIKSGP